MNENQWEKLDIDRALDAVVDIFCFKSESSKNYLIEFIRCVELIKRSQVKQVPALFKKEN